MGNRLGELGIAVLDARLRGQETKSLIGRPDLVLRAVYVIKRVVQEIKALAQQYASGLGDPAFFEISRGRWAGRRRRWRETGDDPPKSAGKSLTATKGWCQSHRLVADGTSFDSVQKHRPFQDGDGEERCKICNGGRWRAREPSNGFPQKIGLAIIHGMAKAPQSKLRRFLNSLCVLLVFLVAIPAFIGLDSWLLPDYFPRATQKDASYLAHTSAVGYLGSGGRCGIACVYSGKTPHNSGRT